MRRRHKRSSIRRLSMSLKLILSAVILLGSSAGISQFKSRVRADEPVGNVKTVIVKYKGVSPVNSYNYQEQLAQRSKIENVNSTFNHVGSGYAEKVRDYDNLPFAVFMVDAAGEESLKNNSMIESVVDDQIMMLDAVTPIPTVGGSATTGFSDGTTNFTGNGYAVAIIDTGVDKNHPALTGKVVAEACFGLNVTYTDAIVTSLCPGGATSSTASGSGQDCTIAKCGHGTKVAGAAAMDTITADVDSDSVNEIFSGVAKNAKIIAIKAVASVQETLTTSDICGDGATLSTCSLPLKSLWLAGLDYVATLSLTQPIAAANLSIGGPAYALTLAECTDQTDFDAVASTLRAHNIAPVVAAGNSGDNPSYTNKIASPACSDKAIAVAATNLAGTAIASYSNNGPLTDLLAPGGDTGGLMWLPENGTSNIASTAGTSFAAPMVAGAYAVLRQAHPNATVSQLTTLLQNTGTNVTDSRSGYTVGAKKLIQIDAALEAATNPIISTFTGPTGTINEGTDITLSIAASNIESCTLNNGVGAVTVTATPSNKTVPAKASYTITCLGAYGDSVSETISFTLNAAPTQPANMQGTGNATARTYQVNWEASTDSDGIESYVVKVNDATVATLGSSARSYLISNVQYGQAYNVKVLAVDTLGAVSQASFVEFNLTDPGTTLGVPNTGAGLLELVSSRQLMLVALGALSLIYLLIRRIRLSFR